MSDRLWELVPLQLPSSRPSWYVYAAHRTHATLSPLTQVHSGTTVICRLSTATGSVVRLLCTTLTTLMRLCTMWTMVRVLLPET